MPRLNIKAEELFSKRSSQIRKLVGDLAGNATSLQIRPQKHALGQIFSVSDSFSESVPPTERLFGTTSNSLYGQYYEIWQPDAQVRNFHLYQNYFHLYAIPTKHSRDQLFCLHAEPEEEFQPLIHRVKSTPHIHVNVIEERLAPVAKAHFPICYSITEDVYRSLSSFDAIFAQALEVIRHEVVNRFV